MATPHHPPDGAQLNADFATEMARYTQQLRQHDALQRQIGYEGAAIRRQLGGEPAASAPADAAPADPAIVRLASWRHRMV